MEKGKKKERGGGNKKGGGEKKKVKNITLIFAGLGKKKEGEKTGPLIHHPTLLEKGKKEKARESKEVAKGKRKKERRYLERGS